MLKNSLSGTVLKVTYIRRSLENVRNLLWRSTQSFKLNILLNYVTPTVLPLRQEINKKYIKIGMWKNNSGKIYVQDNTLGLY